MAKKIIIESEPIRVLANSFLEVDQYTFDLYTYTKGRRTYLGTIYLDSEEDAKDYQERFLSLSKSE